MRFLGLLRLPTQLLLGLLTLIACVMGSSPAQAATMGQLPLIPTRFHLCVQELAGAAADTREDDLRDCLLRRYAAEKTIRKDCTESVRRQRPAPQNADERYKAQRQCFINNLSASYKDLPEVATPHRTLAAAHKAAPRDDDDEEDSEVSSTHAAEANPSAALPPGATPPTGE